MKHARILVIEDDADTADMLKIFFSSQGSSVEIASTGDQGLAAVREYQPDLIILDILLPDMDGYSVCQRLRNTPRGRHIPILFLTQKNRRSDILSGLEIGADDYLTKPFDLEELKLRVRNALERSMTNRQIDARTSLPTGDIVRTKLSRLLPKSGWALLLCRIRGFEALRKSKGLLGCDDLLGRTAKWLEATLRELDTSKPFVGYLSGGDFLVITRLDLAEHIRTECTTVLQSTEGETLQEMSRAVQLPLSAATSEHVDRDNVPAELLDIGLITAEDGPFEDVQDLLQALTHSLEKQDG